MKTGIKQSTKNVFKFFEEYKSAIEVIALLVLVAYTFFTYKQWRVIGAQLDEMRDGNRLEQRAWLATNISSFDIAAGRATVSIQNSGKTPAQHVRHHLEITRMPATRPLLEFTPISPDLLISDSLLGTGQTIASPISVTKPIDDAELKEIQGGYRRVYVRGRVTYQDVFGCEHWIEYCGFYAPAVQQFLTCDSGNEIDTNRCRTDR